MAEETKPTETKGKSPAELFRDMDKFTKAPEIVKSYVDGVKNFLDKSGYGSMADEVYQDFLADIAARAASSKTYGDFSKKFEELRNNANGIGARRIGRLALIKEKGKEVFDKMPYDEQMAIINLYARRSIEGLSDLESNVEQG